MDLKSIRATLCQDYAQYPLFFPSPGQSFFPLYLSGLLPDDLLLFRGLW